MTAVRMDDLYYRLFVEAGAEGMLLVSIEGSLLDVNPEACTFLGRGRKEILDSDLYDMFDFSDPIADCREVEPSTSQAHQGLRGFSQRGSCIADAHGTITVQHAVGREHEPIRT